MKYKLVIKPEGWVDNLIIIVGSSSECGREKRGMHVCISPNDTCREGGVIRREDMVRIVEAFQEHLEKFPLTTKTP